MNETIDIQKYIDGNAEPSELLLIEARLLLNPSMRENLQWQKISHDLVKAYGRKQLKAEIAELERSLFNESRFASLKKTIQTIFKK